MNLDQITAIIDGNAPFPQLTSNQVFERLAFQSALHCVGATMNDQRVSVISFAVGDRRNVTLTMEALKRTMNDNDHVVVIGSHNYWADVLLEAGLPTDGTVPLDLLPTATIHQMLPQKNTLAIIDMCAITRGSMSLLLKVLQQLPNARKVIVVLDGSLPIDFWLSYTKEMKSLRNMVDKVNQEAVEQQRKRLEALNFDSIFDALTWKEQVIASVKDKKIGS